MRIGEFSDSFIPIYDGVGRVVKAYCDTLAKMGHDVYAVCPENDMGFRGRYGFEIIDYYSVSFSDKIPYRVGLSDFDGNFVKRLKYAKMDICHVHTPGPTGLLCQNYAKKNKLPMIGTFHSKYYEDILQTTKSKTLASIGAKAIAGFYSKCDEVWAVSKDSIDELKSYGFKKEVKLMQNGTDKRILDDKYVDIVKSQYKLQDDIPILLFVGQMNWKKNIKKVLEACSLLKKNGKVFKLVLAGKGPHEQEIKEMAKSLNIYDNLLMTGHITSTKQLDALYYVSDLFLFPSTYDCSPLVLREAAAMHTPGLVIENSGPSEVIVNEQNGLITEDDSQSIFEATKKFLEKTKEERESISNNAYNTVPVSWDGELMDRVVERYQYVIDKKNKKKSFNPFSLLN